MRNEPWVWRPEVGGAGTSGAGAVPPRSAQMMEQQQQQKEEITKVTISFFHRGSCPFLFCFCFLFVCLFVCFLFRFALSFCFCGVFFLLFFSAFFCCPINCADLRGTAPAPLVPASLTSGHTQGSFRIAAPPPEVHRK